MFMGKHGSYLRRRRRYLFDKDPHCHWCGCTLVKWEVAKNKTRPPLNAATIDHLRSKLFGKRPDVRKKAKTLVLACWKCNAERSRKENTSIILRPLIWWKSGAFPLYLKPIQLLSPYFWKHIRNKRKKKIEPISVENQILKNWRKIA